MIRFAIAAGEMMQLKRRVYGEQSDCDLQLESLSVSACESRSGIFPRESLVKLEIQMKNGAFTNGDD